MEWATVLLTAVLVLVTIYYAVQTARMVSQMAETRRVSILPKLALEFHRLGPPVVTMAVKNVGPGAALEVDVRLIWVPREGEKRVETRWRRNVFASGEKFDFLPPGDLSANIDSLPRAYDRVRLVGTMRDATGALHEVDERFDDLPEWRDLLGDIKQRYVPEDIEKRLAEELHKKFKGQLDEIPRTLRHVASVIGEVARQQDEEAPQDAE